MHNYNELYHDNDLVIYYYLDYYYDDDDDYDNDENVHPVLHYPENKYNRIYFEILA